MGHPSCGDGRPPNSLVTSVAARLTFGPNSLINSSGNRAAGPEMEKELIEFCRRDLIIWSCPREIEFRSELPLTLVGKVAFAQLADEERAQRGDEADVCHEYPPAD